MSVLHLSLFVLLVFAHSGEQQQGARDGGPNGASSFRGRMRPMDQVAMESEEDEYTSKSIRKIKEIVRGDSFMPMSSSAINAMQGKPAPVIEQRKGEIKTKTEKKKRIVGKSRNLDDLPEDSNSFVFPSTEEKTGKSGARLDTSTLYKSQPKVPWQAKHHEHHNPHEHHKSHEHHKLYEHHNPHEHHKPNHHASNYKEHITYLPVPDKKKKNATSRFFTFNSNRQALDLGLSFTVPFLSIPMASLINIGETANQALSQVLNVNWPSIIVIGIGILCASMLVPYLVRWLTDAFVLKQNVYLNNAYGYSAPNGYSRNLDALWEQLDDALAQYDLDATSCMQRTVCSYVAEAEDSVDRGGADPTQLIINGLSKSSFIQMIFGHSSFSQAVEVGRSGESCKKEYNQCPFSLSGVLRFLASYASFA